MLRKKIKFQYSDVTGDKYLKLCYNLVEYQHQYATHREDVRKKPLLLEFA